MGKIRWEAGRNGAATVRALAVALLALALGACGAGVKMVPAGDAPVIRQGESMIVFMRPSVLGGAVAASVFDVSGPEAVFVGIVNHGTKVAHPLKAGDYTFMVIGESADFMQAKILPGRTYHALVTPRMGVWKARFSFRPVRITELGGAEFAEWNGATQFVENTPETKAWAVQNAASIASKRAEYWPQWASKAEGERLAQTLQPDDGRVDSVAAAAPRAPATAAPAAPMQRAADLNASSSGMEAMFWESIRASTDPADFRAYLEQYPQGAFAALARNRLAALGVQPPAAAPAVAAARPAAPAVRAAGPSGPGGVTVGDSWTYRLTEPRRIDGPTQREYTVKVSSVASHAIVEQYSVSMENPGEWSHSSGGYIAALGRSLFAPYLFAFPAAPSSGPIAVKIMDPACGGTFVCSASARVIGRERVQVPAGAFDTIKVHVEHSWRPMSMGGQAGGQYFGSRAMTVWYAPDVKRAVKFSSRPVIGNITPVDTHFDLELTSYKVGAQ